MVEQILQTILEEIKGVKKEIQETKTELRSEIQQSEKGLREEMQEMKQELREEMQEMKQELREEMQEMKQELRGEMQEMKQELREEMQEIKQELLSEMDKRFTKQSKEIAQELQQMMILQERRNNEFHERLTKLEEGQKEILLEIRKIQTEIGWYKYKISKLEYVQGLENLG